MRRASLKAIAASLSLADVGTHAILSKYQGAGHADGRQRVPQGQGGAGSVSLCIGRSVVAKSRLDDAGHSLAGFRNLDEAGASVGVVHFGSTRAAFIRPIAVAPDFIPVDLVACAH